ncbi:MAG TPA: efflux transporter outer membrane subunit [Steroidobacteraceae bacterium]|nr:efflux transporter outer membrane subunit [Steroidobacteraceae bacterium]
MRRAVLLVACWSLTACLGTPYQRPKLDIPAQYRFTLSEAQRPADVQWWSSFGDPVLDELVLEALRNNEDLRIAAARVDEFHGAMVTTRAPIFPSVGYSASSGQNKPSAQVVGKGNDVVANSSAAGFTAGWEIDVWGKIRNQTAAASADWRASDADRRAAVLTLVSAVTSGYLTLLSLDDQLRTSEATLASRRKALDVFEKRYKGGVISKVELSQARYQYEVAAAAVPVLQEQIARQEDALSLLLGRNPGPIARGRVLLELGTPIVPPGLPSDILAQRPDVVSAEQSLIAANARVSAARALYFPSISLTGLLGVASLDLNKLFDDGSGTWSYAGQATGPIFQGGSNVGVNEQADARREQLLANYEKTVQGAFADVDDALIATQKSTERTEAQRRQVEALGDYARLARKRYEGGYSSYLEVLDAEDSLFNAQLLYSQGQRDRFIAHVDLYKALGGGWVDAAAAEAPQPQYVP